MKVVIVMKFCDLDDKKFFSSYFSGVSWCDIEFYGVKDGLKGFMFGSIFVNLNFFIVGD